MDLLNGCKRIRRVTPPLQIIYYGGDHAQHSSRLDVQTVVVIDVIQMSSLDYVCAAARYIACGGTSDKNPTYGMCEHRYCDKIVAAAATLQQRRGRLCGPIFTGKPKWDVDDVTVNAGETYIICHRR